MILCSQDPLWSSAGKLLHWSRTAWECLLSAEVGDSCTMQRRTVYELASSSRTTFPASSHTGAASREVRYTQVVSHTVTEDWGCLKMGLGHLKMGLSYWTSWQFVSKGSSSDPSDSAHLRRAEVTLKKHCSHFLKPRSERVAGRPGTKCSCLPSG